jgi:hypothetical protein
MATLTVSDLIQILQAYPHQDAKVSLEVPNGTVWYLEPGHIQEDESGEVVIAAGRITGPDTLEELGETAPFSKTFIQS